MAYESLMPIATFVSLSVLVWLSLQRWASRSNDPLNRLEELCEKKPAGKAAKERSAVRELVDRAAPMFSKMLYAKDRIERQKLKLKLSHAGFHVSRAVEVYLTIKGLTLTAGAFLGASIGLMRFGLTQYGTVAIVVGAAFGLFLPDFVLRMLAKRRQEQIWCALPEALDLMVICAEIGQGLDAAILRVTKELNARWPDLATEFHLYLGQVQMGRVRREALRDLGVRAGVDELNSFAAILAQADRFGASIAGALRELSDGLRQKRKSLAEERAQKTAVKLLFPLILFIFPGIFVILVGPAAISLMSYLGKTNP